MKTCIHCNEEEVEMVVSFGPVGDDVSYGLCEDCGNLAMASCEDARKSPRYEINNR